MNIGDVEILLPLPLQAAGVVHELVLGQGKMVGTASLFKMYLHLVGIPICARNRGRNARYTERCKKKGQAIGLLCAALVLSIAVVNFHPSEKKQRETVPSGVPATSSHTSFAYMPCHAPMHALKHCNPEKSGFCICPVVHDVNVIVYTCST